MIFLIIFLILVLIYLFLIFPAKPSEDMKKPFTNRYFAHRGLHNIEKGIPENSLLAFKKAAEKGYGIELDVHITKDDKIIVFHDDDLKRVCGIDKKTDEQTYEYLKDLKLLGTDEKIPLFTEVLEVYGGAGPMVLELKTGKRNSELCKLTLDILKTYKGDVCIESFDPRIVSWFKKNAPQYMRGQLSQPAKDYKGSQPVYLCFFLSRLFTNVIARPHFIAYKLSKKPFSVKLCEKMGALKFSWTSRDINDKKDQDGIIFELYESDLYL